MTAPTPDDDSWSFEDSEPRAFSRVEVWDDPEHPGGAVVETVTNDNDDDGYPDREGTVRWETRWRKFDDAVRHAGKSRVGISGIAVEVYVRGILV